MLMIFLGWFALIARCQSLSSKTLSYSLLNFEETITIPLQNYFLSPSDIKIDDQDSTPGISDILDIKFTEEPVNKVSSMLLSANMSDNTTVDFNSYDVIMEKSVFNYPNKVFLMSNNFVFSIRYQVSNSDNISYVQAFRIVNDSSKCSQIEVQQFNSSYYLFVSCLYSNANSTIYLYKFGEAKSSFLSQLSFLGSTDIKMSSTCTRTTLYSFSELFLKKMYQNRVLLFCVALQNPLLSTNRIFVLKVINNKGVDSLSYQTVLDSTISSCIKNTSGMLQYQNGFIALSQPYLFYYAYNPATNLTYCSRSFLNVKGLKYLISVEDKGIQYIYVIFQQKIMVKESYSPNYQITTIDPAAIDQLELADYSIASRFLALLYKNETDYYILTFDLHGSYPKLVDVLHYPRNYTFLQLFSVRNYLQVGNYYLIYDAVQNMLTLNYYLGYQLSIEVLNSTLALGSLVLALTDGTNQHLVVNMTIRDYDDLTLTKASAGGALVLVEDVLNMNLTEYVVGPLGRFFDYPNDLSAFQYINYHSELNISKQLSQVKENLTTFSINNELSIPILTFYFDNRTILTCSLDYSIQNYKANLSQCKSTKSRTNVILNPTKIVVLIQERYIQFDMRNVELCELSSNGDFQCMLLNIGSFSNISNVKVTSYNHCDKYEDLFLIIYGKKEVKYCQLNREYPTKSYSVSVNYHISQSSLPDLVDKSIVDLKFDQEYAHFLVLRLIGDLDEKQKVIVFDKPQILPNSSSNLIGHVIEAFQKISLEAFFCVNNLLVLVTIELGGFTIREYKITKEYRLRFTRTYPLYGFIVTMGGRHTQNQNFVFLEIEDQGVPRYLVYAPLLPSCNLLTHKIQIVKGNPLFGQQIDPIANSSLFLVGASNLVGVALPNFVFKYLRHPSPSELLLSFNISVVDNYQTLSILNFNFTYDQNQGNIYYITDSDQIRINLTYTSNQTEFFIESKNIKGIVGDYNFTLPDTPQCSGLSIERKDIFTKKQCLLYYQFLQYGTITDFVAYSLDGAEVEVIVTDSNLFCVKNRTLPKVMTQNFTNLTDCQFATFEDQVLMTCKSSNTQSRQIFTINASFGIQDCFVQFDSVAIPDEFVYQDFEIMFTDEYIVFEVPIRAENNKIYYITQFDQGVINNTYALLRKEEDKNVFRTQFNSIDTFLSKSIFLLLEDGIGIYKISDSSPALSPALWISSTELNSKVQNGDPWAYIKYIDLTSSKGVSVLLVELGSVWRSLQVQISFRISANSTSVQTIYELIDIKTDFEYEQYVNCKNSGHSQSQRYQNLIVKICDYQPMVYSVFSNFIAINNDSSNSLIQFYNRSGSRYPVRIDFIYSNTLSHHDFMIRENTLVVGSLFNMLCYYQLTPTLSWKIKHEASFQDQLCRTNLTIFNRQFVFNQSLSIFYDGDSEYPDYWSIPSLYIQRALLVVILILTIRVLIGRWKSSKTRTKRKESNRLYTGMFQVMVKINSKKQI